jgi:hypothetical protein
MIKSMLADLGRSLLRDLGRFVIAFVVGTVAAGIACLYYGLPLVLSLGGGIAVLGFALALNAG